MVHHQVTEPAEWRRDLGRPSLQHVVPPGRVDISARFIVRNKS